MKIEYLFVVILAVVSFGSTLGATTHKHEKHNSKERLKDGSYSPRDAHHNEDGEHHVEFDHEAIIGNVKEAQEYDTLSPEESKKRLTELIRLMDRNADQFVDRHELKSWILRSFRTLSEEEAADRFEEIDANANDKITWQEYLKDVYSMEGENAKKNEIDYENLDEEQKMIQDDKEMFNAADTNKDGSLTLEEFNLFQNPEENPQMLPIVLSQTMRDKDHDKDGKIDFVEFIGSAAKDNDQEWLMVEKERFDKDYDQNNDGVLTGNEVLSWIVPSNEDVANDEVDHLFAAADDDHDDRLTYDEILENYETFVGSEATDYGDHLQNINRLTDEL